MLPGLDPGKPPAGIEAAIPHAGFFRSSVQ
jgi:hypothetical protein